MISSTETDLALWQKHRDFDEQITQLATGHRREARVRVRHDRGQMHDGLSQGEVCRQSPETPA